MSRVLKTGNHQITCKYGNGHHGVDVVKYKNDSDYIVAHSSGTVVWCQTGYKNNTKATGNASYGNAVKIKHANGWYTLYAHMKNVKVKKGQKVARGETIGYMSDSGRAFGIHLHFEVRNKLDVRVNPTNYLSSDLPNNSSCDYQVYDMKKNKWLPNVKANTDDYAGNKNNAIGGVYIDTLEYRVHIKNGNWLPWVKGRNDYAGNLKNEIDGIQIKNATYRVKTVKGKWLPWVCKVDDTSNGYAGIFGCAIDCIQLKDINL